MLEPRGSHNRSASKEDLNRARDHLANERTFLARSASKEDPNRARDHLANERTFLAWVRTGVALIVFGFGIERFTLAIRQTIEVQGRASHPGGLSAWFGALVIIAGVLFTSAGLRRYQQTRVQLESGKFEPAGFVIDLVGILTALFGLVLAGYLIYIKARP